MKLEGNDVVPWNVESYRGNPRSDHDVEEVANLGSTDEPRDPVKGMEPITITIMTSRHVSDYRKGTSHDMTTTIHT